ncbi:MAG: hypothetical protein RJA70_438 [Pseudomonadota bacterium]|jgi:membrane protease YdiL (CAAX protease family)
MWFGLLAPYTLLTVAAVHQLRRSGRFRELLRLRSGDISLGIVVGLVMVAAGMLALRQGFPLGSPQQEWLFTIYAQVGNPNLMPAVLMLPLLACCEELVWRGWVGESLAAQVGQRAALPLTAFLYALAHAPTAFTLSSSIAGPNPLVLLAALGAGLCWAFAARAWGRLIPVIVSHAVFTYFLASPPPPWLP